MRSDAFEMKCQCALTTQEIVIFDYNRETSSPVSLEITEVHITLVIVVDYYL